VNDMGTAYDFPRPVWVDGKNGLRVTIEEGALIFIHPEKADRSIPLRHISRLIVSENCGSDIEWLVACAQRGIPVIVRNHRGEILARVIGKNGLETDFRQRMLELTLDIDAGAHFRSWFLSQERRISRLLVKKLRAPSAVLTGRGQIRNWIEQRAVSFAGCRLAQDSLYALQLVSLSVVQTNLVKLGIDVEDENLLTPPLDLVPALTDLVTLQLQMLRLGWLRRLAGSEQSRRPESSNNKRFIRIFEKRQARIEKTARDLINRLHRWLVERN